MTRRRQHVRSRRVDPFDFLMDDGFNQPVYDVGFQLGSLAEAQAAWEECRTETWRLWAAAARSEPWAHDRAPEGARFHDDVTDEDSVAEFRARRPAAAALIAEELELFLLHRAWWRDERHLTPDERLHRRTPDGCSDVDDDEDLYERTPTRKDSAHG